MFSESMPLAGPLIFAAIYLCSTKVPGVSSWDLFDLACQWRSCRVRLLLAMFLSPSNCVVQKKKKKKSPEVS